MQGASAGLCSLAQIAITAKLVAYFWDIPPLESAVAVTSLTFIGINVTAFDVLSKPEAKAPLKIGHDCFRFMHDTSVSHKDFYLQQVGEFINYIAGDPLDEI